VTAPQRETKARESVVQPGQPTDRPVLRWSVRPPGAPDVIEAIVRTVGVPPLLASALHARGLDQATVGAALDTPLAPSTIPTLAAAADRLSVALKRKERILIHGDYDADGITGAAVLLLGLRSLGANVEAFLPNRLTHGYGVHAELVPDHAARCELFVTVDCGVTNLSEVAELRATGVDVIVTDHHTPGDRFPDALVVHPRVAADGVTVALASPIAGSEPTGSGIAFQLLWALHRRLEIEDPLEYADLAAIGTIADVAPLLGPNRALVREGLARMADSAWPGVRAALKQARVRDAPTARDVAFALAPRLNAAGRLGEPERGLELLTSSSERKASELAVYLDARNDERRRIQDEMFLAALARADHEAPAIVVADDDWHPGVMGIVASKLLERFYRPVFILARGQGSVRSTPGISAVAALRAAAPHLRRYGGHEAAAGFTIDASELAAFRDRIYRFVASHPAPVPSVAVDALLDPTQLDEDLWRSVRGLEPYGEGHPPPRFAICGPLQASRAVGREDRHLQLRLQDVRGVAWNLGERARRLRPGLAVQLAATVRENAWNGRRSIEFVADDVRVSEPLALAMAPAGGERSVAAAVRRGQPPEPGEARVLRSVPLGEDPLRAHEPLAALLNRPASLWFDLDLEAQTEMQRAARRYPTVHEVRTAWATWRRGGRPQLQPDAIDLARRILGELGLLDANGEPHAGDRRDPYASETLVTGLLQRYRIETLLNAYRHLDDAGFERVTGLLYGVLQPDPTGSTALH